MLAIAVTFPAGRYHATPWGRHVNEADVAWPPDPWRLCRALIAVWHRKIDPPCAKRATLSALLARLASAAPPHIRLPERAIHAHTRHYMPLRDGKPTLVFDAFARLATDDPLVFEWPDLALPPEEEQLLDELLGVLGYLGRAESWVDARRTQWNGPFNCLPADGDAEKERDGTVVRLLVPLPPEQYAAVRAAHLDGGGSARGRSGRGTRTVPVARLRATLPADWLDALSVETADLQAAGWSAPPAARVVSYRRPSDALRPVATATSPRRLRRQRTELTTVRYRIYGRPLPRLEEALRVGERLRMAAMGCGKGLLGADQLPPELSGHGAEELGHHRHAFWLCEPNERGEIEHVLIHVPGGMGPEAVRVVTALRWLRRDEGDSLHLMLEAMGPASLFAEVAPMTATAAVWRSVTPYLHPWHLKKSQVRSPAALRDAILAQLRREWEGRGAGLPEIVAVDEVPAVVFGGRELRPVHFQRVRRKRGLTQPDTLGRFLVLHFSEPIRGPLAMGYGCHFGLGLFQPNP